VIRTTTLFLVLALAGTPAATALCLGKCGVDAPPTGTAATCHQRTTREGMPGLLAGEHGCDDLLQAEPFVREDVQRNASGSASDHAVVTVAFRIAGWTPSRVDGSVHRELPVFRAPDQTPLRI
jgi:hypothetical protein